MLMLGDSGNFSSCEGGGVGPFARRGGKKNDSNDAGKGGTAFAI